MNQLIALGQIYWFADAVVYYIYYFTVHRCARASTRSECEKSKSRRHPSSIDFVALADDVCLNATFAARLRMPKSRPQNNSDNERETRDISSIKYHIRNSFAGMR